MRRETRGWLIAVAVGGLLALTLPEVVVAQCAMCQTALTNSLEGQRIAGEFNKAILLMMAAPYAVFGSVLAFAFRARLRCWLHRWTVRRSSAHPRP